MQLSCVGRRFLWSMRAAAIERVRKAALQVHGWPRTLARYRVGVGAVSNRNEAADMACHGCLFYMWLLFGRPCQRSRMQPKGLHTP